MTIVFSKRTRISIGVFLTLLAGCAWESSWFGKNSIASPRSAETRR